MGINSKTHITGEMARRASEPAPRGLPYLLRVLQGTQPFSSPPYRSLSRDLPVNVVQSTCASGPAHGSGSDQITLMLDDVCRASADWGT